MSSTPTWVLIFSSAAIGALISSIINEVGKSRERQARRKELLFTKAIEMAQERFRTLLDAYKQQEALIPPQILMVPVCHYLLSEIMDKGKLDDNALTEAKRLEEESFKRVQSL